MSGPLQGIRVVELASLGPGPHAAMVLADLGAEVVRVEGPTGRGLRFAAPGSVDSTLRGRRVEFANLKEDAGRDLVLDLVAESDVLIEGFRPGVAERLGVGPEQCHRINPRLVYCALKGFLPGPYEKRPALDEVVQMMGGLAYMTGPSGRPLRAGTSVIDIVGGMFGAFGTVLALKQRDRTGKGGLVESALFESVVFLMGQHLAITAINGAAPPPMPNAR